MPTPIYYPTVNISYNWLKEHIALTAPAQEVAQWLTQTGLEVAKITPYEPLPATLVIGHTLACSPHPNADRLKQVTVDIGQEAPLHIICGAPNVDKGQKVVVAPVGTVLTTPTGERYTIKKTKIRGIASEGMICAASEIGLGEESDGILVLHTNDPAGTPAATHFGLPADTIFEIEITPNMGNACSHLGVARELAAFCNKQVEPPTNAPLIPSDDLPITVNVEDPLLCPRYTGVIINALNVAPSPIWLQNRLRAIGVKPINNIVDITNFVMHGIGQPLHAFDYDKIVGNKLFVKQLKKRKVMTTLDGSSCQLIGSELTICDEEGPLCLAGIIGGERAKVTESTTTIFLESACFQAAQIAKTARRHTIHTDSSFRFERGSDIEMPYLALEKAAALIQEVCGGEVASSPVDHYPAKATKTAVKLSYAYINKLIGKELPRPTIHAILKRLDIAIKEVDDDGFTAMVPPYRTNVTRPADIVEEIIRIHGYEHILPVHTYKGMPYPSVEETSAAPPEQIAHLLVGQGYHEIFTNSLMARARLQAKEKDLVAIANPLSQGLDILRPTLLYTGLETISYNLNRGNQMLKLFEYGKVYHTQEEGYHEEEKLSLFLAGHAHAPHWSREKRAVALHDLYTLVTQLFQYAGIDNVHTTKKEHPYYDQCLVLTDARGKVYTHIGQVRSDICRTNGIKIPVFFTEIPLPLAPFKEKKALHYKPIPQAPAITRDLSLELDQHITFAQVEKTIHAVKVPYAIKLYMTDRYQGKNIATGKKSYTIHLHIQGNKTFKEKEIDRLIKQLTTALQEKLGATLRA